LVVSGYYGVSTPFVCLLIGSHGVSVRWAMAGVCVFIVAVAAVVQGMGSVLLEEL
jgi:hypothetical protein